MQIRCDTVPKVLLLGNGINRAYESESWDELIDSISTKKLSEPENEAMKSVPNQFRPVILTDDHIDVQLRENSQNLIDIKVPEGEAAILKDFANLNIDAILTTNYTYELEKTLIPNFKCERGKRCKWRGYAHEGDKGKWRNQLSAYFSFGMEKPLIWHIHGEAVRPDTMILGHYYYGNLLAKMRYKAAAIVQQYKSCQTKKLTMLNVHGWLEYFLLGDIYIVGCGLSFSEIDLWWLINYKKRNFPNSKVVLYKPDINLGERMLAEAYNVEIRNIDFKIDFKKYYSEVLNDLKVLI